MKHKLVKVLTESCPNKDTPYPIDATALVSIDNSMGKVTRGRIYRLLNMFGSNVTFIDDKGRRGHLNRERFSVST